MTQEEKETLLGWVKESDTLRLVPHKDYEIKHDGDNFYLVKKKPKYPETYEECCKVLMKYTNTVPNVCGVSLEEFLLFSKLIRLKRCREAYWKIAGEEMGLGKSWEPDWEGEGWYVIVNHRGDIVTDVQWHANAILAFPTEEMRDAFYEAFKELIEECKELL